MDENHSNLVTTEGSSDKAAPLMRLTDVWKIYRMGEVEFAALKNVDLEILHGEFVVILGPSGSGKSTMMNLLGCLDLPSKGIVELNNRDISRMQESELAQIRGQLIGFIFQQFNLIPTLNTIENVMLPLEFQEADPDLSWKRAEELLNVVSLSDKKYNLPSQLSGGQRQRVAIARSLAVDPKVILADEPTGNLDSETGNYILEFLSDLHQKEGKTIIMITHDPDLTRYADRVVHIKDGMVDSIEIKNREAM
ncbi:ABC transporter ATP-binding protein [Methanolobus sp. ZRKC2]|uniref:ABC transporter ATP-binding protein n=1 Tax=Methanolobus sp. ZRKC2 TaxID=3125783 RepID=UPI00324E06B9